MPKKIVAISSSRADYSHMYWVLKALEDDKDFNLTILCFGPHLSPKFGDTWKQIKNDGFKNIKYIESLLSSDTDIGMAKSLGLAILSITDFIAELRPDLMLIIADRYEMLAPATVAMTMRIPIAHIEGGDVSEGAIDDAVRNALTKMSHIHFTPTKKAMQRVLAMGEEAWRVHLSGAPSLDHLNKSKLPTPQQIIKQFKLDKTRKTLLVAFHPVTLYKDSIQEQTSLFNVLKKRTENIIFIFPNADAGSHQIITEATKLCNENNTAKLYINLSAITYLGLLSTVDLLIGNSSSGIMEAPSLKLPTINIGIRQKGREQAKNIIDSESNELILNNNIEKALSNSFKETLTNMQNPYGNGTASKTIVNILKTTEFNDNLLFKKNIL